MSVKTSRFADVDFENKQLASIYSFWNHPLVPLEQTLNPILPLINQLDRYIKVAKENCTYPSEHRLTYDESAALYLYTMECGKDSFYRVLNRTLRSEDRSSIKPWFAFLKLFDTALTKLPSIKKVIWRGVRHNVSKEFKENQEVTWWNVNSCSSSVYVIKNFLNRNSTLFLIEALNGKDVSDFTNYPNEDEIILGPGTRLRVVGNAIDHIGGLHVVHFKEITNIPDEELSMMKAPATEKLRTKTIIEMGYAKLISTSRSGLPKIIKNKALGKEDSKTNEGKISMSYPNGDRYEGVMKDSKKHGQGTYYFVNGDKYAGEWDHDKMNGQGTFVWSIGNRYEGTYKDGAMHGYGTFSLVNGEKYVGAWADNMRNGRGRYSWPNGDYYDGDHKDNTFHGEGKHVLADGQVRQGNWKYNQLID